MHFFSQKGLKCFQLVVRYRYIIPFVCTNTSLTGQTCQYKFQFIYIFHYDLAENGSNGKLGKAAHLEDWITTITSLTAGESAFKVTFDYDQDFGYPGAFLIRNSHFNEFYLKSLTLEDVPGHGRVHYICNSWVYPAKRYTKDRVFFSNKVTKTILYLIRCSLVRLVT